MNIKVTASSLSILEKILLFERHLVSVQNEILFKEKLIKIVHERNTNLFDLISFQVILVS